NMLLNQGYPEPTVQRFFAPLTQGNLDLVDKREEARQFHAYIDGNGNLVNRGLVATGRYVAQLEQELGERMLYRAADGGRGYVMRELADVGERLVVGLRKLGFAQFKGLEKLTVYEFIDAGAFGEESLADKSAPLDGGLVGAVDREFARSRNGAAGLL